MMRRLQAQMVYLPRPGYIWEEWEPEVRNGWLHTHILREPYFCSGAFTELAMTGKNHLDYLRMRRFGCHSCGYCLMVTHTNLQTMPHKAIFPEYHTRQVPPYTQEMRPMKQMLETVLGYGPCALAKQILLRLGGQESDRWPLEPSLVTTLIGLEVMGTQPDEIGHHLYQAYQKILFEDQKYFTDGQEHFMERCTFMKNEEGIPLFARVGPPQESYHKRDLPYLLSYPSLYGRFEQWAEVLVAECSFHEWAPYLTSMDIARTVEKMEDALKKQFREMDGPRRFVWSGPTYYWSFRVNLFS